MGGGGTSIFVGGSAGEPCAQAKVPVKKINPDTEIIVQTYVPTPQPNGMYGGVDQQIGTQQTIVT